MCLGPLPFVELEMGFGEGCFETWSPYAALAAPEPAL